MYQDATKKWGIGDAWMLEDSDNVTEFRYCRASHHDAFRDNVNFPCYTFGFCGVLISERGIDRSEKQTERLATAVVNDKIYAFGGWRGDVVANAREYDPATDKWTEKADLPNAGAAFTACAVDGKIYIIGWFSNVLEYDPESDTYTGKSWLPYKSWWELSACVIEDKIYAMGSGGEEEHGRRMAVYEPVTDTWEIKPEMPTSRAFLATAVVNGRIYAIGGTPPGPNVDRGGGTALATVEEYDTGFREIGVEPKGKLPTMWGAMKERWDTAKKRQD